MTRARTGTPSMVREEARRTALTASGSVEKVRYQVSPMSGRAERGVIAPSGPEEVKVERIVA